MQCCGNLPSTDLLWSKLWLHPLKYWKLKRCSCRLLIARLVERLIAGLDIDPAIEEAWAAEVERRNAEIESGAVPLIPGPEALAELKAQFR